MYAAAFITLFAAAASAQDVTFARIEQFGKCLTPDSPTFNAPVHLKDCSNDPNQIWEISKYAIHLKGTDFCLSSGRNPRHRCTGNAFPKPGNTFNLIGCPRDGPDFVFVCETWTFQNGGLHNTKETEVCVAGSGGEPKVQNCDGKCEQQWTLRKV